MKTPLKKGIGSYSKGKKFQLRSGNTPSGFKMMGSTTPYKQTDEEYAKMQEKSAKNDPRYGKMTPEEYKAEVQRQVKSKKETGSYDAMNTAGNKENKEVNVTETDADGITENITDTEVPKVNKLKTAAGAIGSVLTGAFTGGLDAVYGTGKVLKGGDIKFSKPKKEEDEKTGEQKVDEIINKEA